MAKPRAKEIFNQPRTSRAKLPTPKESSWPPAGYYPLDELQDALDHLDHVRRPTNQDCADCNQGVCQCADDVSCFDCGHIDCECDERGDWYKDEADCDCAFCLPDDEDDF